jgi:hypothetical protein
MSNEPASPAEPDAGIATVRGIAVVPTDGQPRTGLQQYAAWLAMLCFAMVTCGLGLHDRIWPRNSLAAPSTLVLTATGALGASLDPAWLDQSSPLRSKHAVRATMRESWRSGPSLMFWCELNEPLLRALWQPGRGLLDIVGPEFPREFAVFTAPDSGLYPRFRYPPSTTLPDGLTTNNFGFRGPDLTLYKPERTIRIACVGASAVVDIHHAPWSGPELLQNWLNQWALSRKLDLRFEVLNAARDALTSTDIRAVVEWEVLPFDIDYIIYYEGANQCGQPDLQKHVRLLETDVPPHGPAALHLGSHIERSLPPLAFLRQFSHGGHRLSQITNLGRHLPEPPKPAQELALPSGIDEMRADLARQGEILQMGTILRDLDRILGDCRSTGTELLLCSFAHCVQEGMLLDMEEGHSLYSHLNGDFWPLSYANMRRLFDLQNRYLRAWAGARKIRFFDLAAQFPNDPGLFLDVVHTTEFGSRLRNWLLLANLIPVITADLERGKLPRKPSQVVGTHPHLGQSRRLTAAELDHR